MAYGVTEMTLGLALIDRKKREGCFSVGTQVGCERRVDLTFPKHVLYPWVAPSSGAGAGKIERLVCVFLVQVELWGGVNLPAVVWWSATFL